MSTTVRTERLAPARRGPLERYRVTCQVCERSAVYFTPESAASAAEDHLAAYAGEAGHPAA